MSKMTSMIDIGFSQSDGEPDFRISMAVAELDMAAMQRLRAMIPVAIAQAERIWVDEQMRRPENQACQNNPSI